MSTTTNLSRRRFLRNSSLAAGGLVLGATVPWGKVLAATAAGAAVLEPNALIAVGPDGRVVMQFTWNELGQGAMTSLAMTVADELAVPLASVDVHAPVWEPKYGNNITGGSSSMRESWEPLRKAAAAARTMLIEAGAGSLGVPVAECRAENGRVVHASGRAVDYAEVVEAAAELSVPDDPQLTGADTYRHVGRRIARLDTPAKVRGEPVFPSDLERPDAICVAVARCPHPGGRPTSVDEAAARAVPGVRDVVRLDDRVAVAADDVWSAFRGRDALTIEWSPVENGPDSDALYAAMERALEGEAVSFREDGDVEQGLADAARTLTARYRIPFISHAPMEPTTCVVEVSDGTAFFEGPTQAPWLVSQALASVDGVDRAEVTSTWVGSAFGRRIMADYAAEAATVALRLGGPVRMAWSREDEMRHDFYRPGSLHDVAAGLDDDGRVTTFRHVVAAPSIGHQHFPRPGSDGSDRAVVSGVATTEYVPANMLAAHAPIETAAPLGWWRGVFDVQNAFVNECFLDELAAAAGRDPVELRLELLPGDARLRRVVEEAARRSGWPEPSAPGRSVGFACHGCFGSVCAQTAEVSVGERGDLRVHRIVSVIECGVAVNPDAIKAQMEGGVAMGLGTALREEITFGGGAVDQGNFDDYRPLRIDEMPEVECHILESDRPIGGVGEPVLPPTAPAVCNAIFAATGVRIRELPVADKLVRS